MFFQLWKRGAWSRGSPIISVKITVGSCSAKSATKSHAPSSMNPSIRESATSRMRPSMAFIRRGENTGISRVRYRDWTGGSTSMGSSGRF